MTNNLDRRLVEHNANHSAGSRGKGPYVLVYSEKHLDRISARAREKFFKSGKFRDNREKFLRAVSSVG